uniref:G_PROTEIN_RECEP_F1_2 domain-containing protein n=1 Tax=Heterorhabditis bacteriophora TaxID=37862 RepID=A0A1I7WMR6_HETBA
MDDYSNDGSESSSDVPNMHFAKGVMTVVYVVVFLIGTPGNLWIIYKLIRARLWNSSAAQLTVSQRSRMYIFALACSDLVLLLTLPLTASYNYNGTWMFGAAYVHIYIYIYTYINMLTDNILTTHLPFKTTNSLCFVDELHTFVRGDGFLCGGPLYVPLLSYYTSSVHQSWHVTVSSSKSIREPRYMNEVRKSIWRIAVFHFVCWAPFWTFTIVPHYITQYGGQDAMEAMPDWNVYCRLFANCLPYINAAGSNWVLYAVLNYDVRKHIYRHPKKKFVFQTLSTV